MTNTLGRTRRRATEMQHDDEDSLVEAARKCDDCLGWLEHCEAECCSVFTFYLTPRSDVVYLEDTVRIHAPMTPDLERYYALHGASVEEGEILVVRRANCEVSTTRLVVTMRCTELRDDFLCALHDGRQPESCAEFTRETASSDDWIVTPRCLLAYKAKVVSGSPQDGKRA
jgi:hypothetical protein